MSKLRKIMAAENISEFELDQLAEDIKVTLIELANAAREANKILNKAKGTDIYSEFYDETIMSFNNSNMTLDKLADWAERAANTSQAY